MQILQFTSWFTCFKWCFKWFKWFTCWVSKSNLQYFCLMRTDRTTSPSVIGVDFIPLYFSRQGTNKAYFLPTKSYFSLYKVFLDVAIFQEAWKCKVWRQKMTGRVRLMLLTFHGAISLVWSKFIIQHPCLNTGDRKSLPTQNEIYRS